MSGYTSPEARQRAKAKEKLVRYAEGRTRPLLHPTRWTDELLTETWEQRKLRRAMETTTTVSLMMSAAHDDPDTGTLHGHDYEVRAEFPRGERFEVLKVRLKTQLQNLDHTHLPSELWAAESIGEWLFDRLPGVIEIQVNRPWLGHFAKVRR